MDIQLRVISTIFVLVCLILLAAGLRRAGLVKESNGQLFSTLVTRVTLPALIFKSLAHSVLHWEYAVLALLMLMAEVASLGLAWLGGRAMRLSPPQLGSVMLVAGFGSSSLLGYALISQVYSSDNQAIAEAVIISELGVGPALFTLGTMIALFYGSSSGALDARITEALKFFRSPIFFSVLLGLGWSFLALPTDTAYLKPLFQALEILGSANTLLVAMTVGLVLHLQGLKSLFGVALLVVTIKLILKPVLVWLPATGLGMTDTQIQILVLEAAMPSAMLAVVLASSYGCDARLASRLVLVTSLASCITVVTMFRLLT
jgi:predicted permease